jgi:hypothetical protein
MRDGMEQRKSIGKRTEDRWEWKGRGEEYKIEYV